MFAKIIVLFFLVGINTTSILGQVPQIEEPVIQYVSDKLDDDTRFFKAGYKRRFSQNCTKLVPENVVNGVVQFERMKIKGLQVEKTIFFKDTLIQKVVTVYKGKKINEVLAYFEMQGVVFTELDKHTSTAMKYFENQVVTCELRKNAVPGGRQELRVVEMSLKPNAE